ncbi:MAG: metallophosphoesterase family protein [Planctomycetota bacterium]|nr:metallophosphoesterase family protein [Planctomycetota bacterium]
MDYPLTALISDLHANVPAIETALADARARGAQRFICLGDMVGYGADPCFALDQVMMLCVPGARDPLTPERTLADGICLRGNHEEALLESAADFNPKAKAAIEWTREELLRKSGDGGPDYFDFIDRLSSLDTHSDPVAMFAHGSPFDPVREYMLPRDIQDAAKMKKNFGVMKRDVCFVGHSHVPAIYYQDGTIFRPNGTDGPYALGATPTKRAIVNVGSVGQPRDGDPRLSYVMFDGHAITFVRLAYDHARAAASIRAVKELPEYLAERLALGR